MEGEQEEAGAVDSQEQTSEAQPHTSTDSSLTFRLLNTLLCIVSPLPPNNAKPCCSIEI